MESIAYRFDDQSYSLGTDEYGDALPGYSVRILCHEYSVIKHTPKGFRIRVWNDEKFINLGWRKKYACLTKSEAWESFLHRKAACIRKLRKQLGYHYGVLNLALSTSGCILKDYSVIFPAELDWKAIGNAYTSHWACGDPIESLLEVQKILTKITEAHDISEVDWAAMKKAKSMLYYIERFKR